MCASNESSSFIMVLPSRLSVLEVSRRDIGTQRHWLESCYCRRRTCRTARGGWQSLGTASGSALSSQSVTVTDIYG
ncbi:hypothetical protein BKA18_004648 [Streptomyces auratus]